MAVWLVRAGSHGEHEQRFIAEKRVYVTWEGLDVDLSSIADRAELASEMSKRYPDEKPRTIRNWASQVYPFARNFAKGDLVVLPLKSQPAIQIGQIAGDYRFVQNGPDPFYHWRSVKWIGDAIPRANFSQDLLYSFGAFMTICRIQRNNAETRLRTMWEKGWIPETTAEIVSSSSSEATDADATGSNLEELARDQIGKLIVAKFKGHGLARLVDAILRAQGYTTYLSPEGADGGADILAGAGPLGFGRPRLCVEVKSTSGPIDRPSVDKLLGAVTKFKADEGLFVSLGGFKANVPKELAASFFQVRLWTESDVIDQLLLHYDQLPSDIRAELPLKRVWMVAEHVVDSE